MTATTERLQVAAIAAVDALHGDTSCPQRDTLAALVEVREHLSMLIDAVEQTIVKADDDGGFPP